MRRALIHARAALAHGSCIPTLHVFMAFLCPTLCCSLRPLQPTRARAFLRANRRCPRSLQPTRARAFLRANRRCPRSLAATACSGFLHATTYDVPRARSLQHHEVARALLAERNLQASKSKIKPNEFVCFESDLGHSSASLTREAETTPDAKLTPRLGEGAMVESARDALRSGALLALNRPHIVCGGRGHR
jgi:hypothetical protein